MELYDWLHNLIMQQFLVTWQHIGATRSFPNWDILMIHRNLNSLQQKQFLATGAGRGIANLDVLLQGNNIFLGVESKLIEPLTKKKADFSDKYHSVIESVADPSWRSVYNTLKKQQDNYTHLDAAQLVKHYLGLRQTPNEKSVILVYLYWEPMNAKDISIYQKHTEEIKDLKERLSGADTPLLSISYPELWREMEASNPKHVARLRERYEFAVE